MEVKRDFERENADHSSQMRKIDETANAHETSVSDGDKIQARKSRSEIATSTEEQITRF